MVAMFIGSGIFALGFIAFAAMLFASGGVSKSQQFRVIGDLLRGRRGRGPQLAVLGSFPVMALGALVAFAGVAARGEAKREQCQAFCVAEGYSEGRIGPNSDRVPGNESTYFVACRCEGGVQPPLEIKRSQLP